MKILQIGDMCKVGINLHKAYTEFGFNSRILISSRVEEYSNDKHSGVVINPLFRFGCLKYFFLLFYVVYFRADVIHAHGMGAVFPFLLRKKYFLHCHGSDIRGLAKRKGLLANLYKIIVKNSERVFLSTSDLILDAKTLKVPVSKYLYIPNPVETKKVYIAKITNKPTLNLFCPSSDHFIKHKRKMFKAYELLRKKYGGLVTLTVVDYGQTKTIAEQEITDFNARVSIKYISRLSNCEMLQTYKDYDVVLDQFSDMNIHGVIAFESLASGTPVVSTVQVDEFKYSSMLPGSTITEIYKSVESMFDYELRQKVSRNGLEWVKLNLDRNVIAKRFICSYKSCT